MNLSNHKNKLTIIRRAGIRLISFGVISIFICVFIAMNFIAIASPKQAVASECSNNGDISGTVFYDYNNNGFQDDDEPGIGGVIVSGYISSSTGLLSGGTACESRADGSYNFTQTQFPVRLEFTLSKELETYLKPGPTNFDVGTGSTVQVVNAPSISINVGYHDPADYCGNNVEFGTTCFTYGVSTNITTPQEAVVSINYFEPAPVEIGVDVRFPAADQTVRGTTAEVGSVLGLAYHGQRQNLFTAAWVKRHVDLGPNGAGAIYRLDTNSNQTSLFFDLNSLPGSPAGTVESRPDPPVLLWRAVGDPQPHLFYDVDAYLKAGTTGIGDIDLSPDEKTLFAVNMADKKLYLLPGDPFATVTVNDVSSVAIPNTCPNPADARPMALGYNNGKMYVGSICTAESVVDLEVSPFYTRTNNITFVNSAEFETIFADSFYAEVFEFDIETSAFNSIPVLTAPLIYDRGCAFLLNVETGRGQNPDCSNGSNSINQTSNWRPWQSNWREVYDDATNSGETRVSSGFTLEYPQPILADIEFDGEDMILGLRDIHADRTGHAMGAPDTISPPGGFNATVPFRTAGLGDILRACWDESSASWQLESNATCGGITTAGTNEGEGLNGGEFYWDDSTPGGPNNIGANSWIDNGVNNMGHSEGGMGMLMHVPGRNQTVASAIDISEFYDAGLIWFNDETGASDKRVKLFSAPFIFNGDSLLRENGGLKAANANSIGDIEAFCAAAPIEIGNLIWLDENQNGLQDPGESAAAGVTVQLFSEFDTSSSLATAVTDANGNYIFSSGEGSNSTSAVYNINIDPETTYRVIVEKNQAGTPIENRLVTTANSISDANGDMRDSDAISTVQNGLPVAQVLFTTGSIGENDHSFDIGFYEEQINPPPPVDACGSLLNGGFEDGFNHWIEQGIWEIVPGRTGNGIAISQEYINQMISAEGSADFVLSGYYKLEGHNSQADNGSNSWSGIGLDYLQNGNEVGESLAHFTADTNGFVYFEISGTTTPDTDEISLWIFSNFGAVLTVDDLELAWTNCEPDPPPLPPACGPLLNGGFEKGFNHWSEEGAWEIVPGRSGNGIAISQEYINQMIAAGKNSDFILSGYYKLEGHNSQAANGSTSWSGVGVDYLQDGTKVGETLAHFTADTDGFVYFEINGTTTPDTDGIEVWIFSNFGAVLTVDNLELTWSNCDPDIDPPPPAEACGPLLNGGFEDGFNHWTEQGAWEIVPGRTGNGIEISQNFINQKIAVDGDADFKLTGHYKLEGHNSQTANGNTSWSGMGVDYLANDDEFGSVLFQISSDTDGYVSFTLSGTVPDGADEISFWIFSNFGAVLTVDDLQLTWDSCNVESSPPPPPPPTPLVESCKDVANGDFESGFNSWIEEGSWDIVAGHSGNALAVSQGSVEQQMPVSGNKQFVLSGYYKLEGHNSQAINGNTSWSGIGLDFIQRNQEVGEVFAQFTADTNGFVYFEIEGTTPRSYSANQLKLWVFSNFGAVLTVDDLKLTWTDCIDGRESDLSKDRGDLPDSFSTTSSTNGPTHIIVDGLYLGKCIDGEPFAWPSAQANGDDGNSAGRTESLANCERFFVDEDGISFRTFTPEDKSVAVCSEIDIFVTGSVPASIGSDGYLNAWADLNADGNFSSDEQFVFDNEMNMALVSSTTTLNFPRPLSGESTPNEAVQLIEGLKIPCDQNLVGQDIGFRFRFTGGTTAGGSSPTGAATNGEVEDYILPISN